MRKQFARVQLGDHLSAPVITLNSLFGYRIMIAVATPYVYDI
jgi:hypothetical protein